jgi:P pilus assembly chaperone PapD
MKPFGLALRASPWFGIFLALCLCLAAAASAMSVTPILIDLKPGGRMASGQIRVVNTTQGPLPVDLKVKAATVGPDGRVTTSEEGIDDLLIFPPQALIAPGATQVFRVQWVGDPELSRSKTFMVSVAQQPVALPEGTSGIQLLYDFQVVVNVAPMVGEPDLQVRGAELTTDDQGARRATVTLANDSNVHGYLSGANLRLELQDDQGRRVWSQSYSPEDLRARVGIGLLQPGVSRRFQLPFDLPAEGTRITAEVSYAGRR